MRIAKKTSGSLSGHIQEMYHEIFYQEDLKKNMSVSGIQ